MGLLDGIAAEGRRVCFACTYGRSGDRYGHNLSCPKHHRNSPMSYKEVEEARQQLEVDMGRSTLGIGHGSPVGSASDAVKAPSHYMLFDGTESIEVIARSMTVSEFRGFCFGNVLKYRLRAGKKSELATMEQDLKKSAYYQELFDKHRGLCYAE